MHACLFEIQYETGKRERIEVENDRILMGSGAHCDIRLAPEVASFEHLILTAEPSGVVVRVIPNEGQVALDGAPIRHAHLADGSRLTIGEVTIVYRTKSLDAGKKKKGPSFVVILAALFVPAALFVAMHAKSDNIFAPPDNVPSPLAEPITQCPGAQTREQALALAKEKDALAQAKRQRWKFYTRDGVEAVVLFEVASACYAAAGDPENSAAAGLLARAMRAGILQEFQVYRVRLERALERDDPKVALAQIHFLRDMLFARDIDDDYVRWLTIMQRKLEARVSQAS